LQEDSMSEKLPRPAVPDRFDVLAIAGLVLLAGGAAWIWLPLGFVVFGLAALALALLGAAAHGGDGKLKRATRGRRRQHGEQLRTETGQDGRERLVASPVLDKGRLCEPDEGDD
jgi:hypothetical protein